MPRTHKSQHAAKKEDEEMQKEYKLFTLDTELLLLCIRRKTFIIPAKNLKKIKDLDSREEMIWLLNPSINCWDLKSSQNLKRNDTDELTYKTETHRLRE